MDVLVPQRMMIIKPPNSIISPLLFITILGLKKKKRFEIWAEGCGAIWQHKQNYPNTSETSGIHFSLCSVTICELNM